MKPAVDLERARAAVCEFLRAFGENPDRPELRETPSRVAASWAQMLDGRGGDPAGCLSPLPGQAVIPGQAVAVADIAFRSVCEHHLLPFSGTAHMVYQPNTHLVGVGAFGRLIEALASRLQIQERLGDQIADAISGRTAAHGVIVVLTARHGCMSDRGMRHDAASVTTIATRGSYVGASIADVIGLIDLYGARTRGRSETVSLGDPAIPRG